MKKKVLGFFLLAVFVLALAVPAYAAQNYVVSGTKNYLAVRSEPKTSANNEIGKLYNGDIFSVSNWNANGFAYGCTSYGVWGFVNNSYLRATQSPSGPSGPSPYGPSGPSPYGPSGPGSTPTGTPRTVAGVKNYLGLRSTPTRNAADEIGKIYNGQQFNVLEFRRDGFAYGVAPNGQTGYVVSAYLK